MERLKMHSPDITEKNIRKLAELFPNCVTESRDKKGKVKHAIDFDLLKQELSSVLVEGPQERYRLDWPGKRKALLTANAPIAKTLRPCREESVDFDTTENLFIEGDNLDALKLLQETYLGKVKMIYIDPPYNTGKDFIYKDRFAQSVDDYLLESGQKDEEGNRLVTNSESNGRFHSDWLSMMYPRLKLARNLLRDDGVIFISIDDNEVANLRKLCDEVFGEKCFVGQVTVLCNPKGRSQDKYLATCHEYLLIYSKNTLPKGILNVPKSTKEIERDYPMRDAKGIYRELELRNTHREFGKHNRPNLYYPFYIDETGTVSLKPIKGGIKVLPIWDDGFHGCWTWGKDKAANEIDNLVAKKVNGNWKVYRKAYASTSGERPTKQLKTIWSEKEYHTEKGQQTFNELFNSKFKIFQSPKSLHVILNAIAMACDQEAIILDFFAGSCTTAHAVMELNAEDGGNRKFIMIQFPEPCDKKSEAFKAGYKTIAEIGKERIRRAAAKIREEHPDWDGDTGFRVLKVDSSNLKDVYYRPDALEQPKLRGLTDHIKEDRTPEDLLFQVLLDWGVDLSLPITREIIAGREVFFVDENALAACFEKTDSTKPGITEDFVKELAKREPLRVVFLDQGFRDDSVKINVEQIFKVLSPHTEVKTI